MTSSLEERISALGELLEKIPPSPEEVEAVTGKYVGALSKSESSVVGYVHAASGCIKGLCEAFYGSSGERGTGEISWPEQRDPVHRAKLQDATLIPVPGSYDIEQAAGLLSYASLYSGHGVLVLPFNIEDGYISYSGSYSALSRISHYSSAMS